MEYFPKKYNPKDLRKRSILDKKKYINDNIFEITKLQRQKKIRGFQGLGTTKGYLLRDPCDGTIPYLDCGGGCTKPNR